MDVAENLQHLTSFLLRYLTSSRTVPNPPLAVIAGSFFTKSFIKTLIIAVNRKSSGRKVRISTIKLHKITYGYLRAFSLHALSFQVVVDPFITLPMPPQKTSKSYNCQRENAENRCLRRPTCAFSRSIKLIVRYYSAFRKLDRN